MKKIKPVSFGVIGLGRFGTALAKSLAESGKEVIVIDCNEDKVRELRHFTEHAFVLEKIGAEVVYPERDMALRLGKRLVSQNFLDYISLDNEVEIQQIPVTEAMIGRSVQETDIRQQYGLNIIAIEREHVTEIEVSPQYRFSEGDIIVVIGKAENIKRFADFAGKA